MKCPKCWGDAHTIDSRIRSDGSIRRRRKCLECAYRFTTTEVLADAIEKSISRTSYEYCFLNQEYTSQNCKECPYRKRCLGEGEA